MFFSHEILTSRKHGVATVWLMATLGSHSGLGKKVKRAQIFNVDIPRACRTILEPQAPLALRLQGNLLFGVSRVYGQQCEYILSDLQTAKNGIQKLLVVERKTLDLDIEAGRNRAEQLVLPDDPSFTVDLAFPPLDLAGEVLDFSTLPELSKSVSRTPSRRSSVSINLPVGHTSSITGAGGIYLAGEGSRSLGLTGDLPKFEDGGVGLPPLEDDEAFLSDIDVEFDEEGNLRNRGTAAGRGRASVQDLPRLQGEQSEIPDRDDEVMLRPIDDQEALQSSEQHAIAVAEEIPGEMNVPSSPPVVESSESSIHEQVKRIRVPRALGLDQVLEIPRRELQANNTNYVANMAEHIGAREQRAVAAIAKKHGTKHMNSTGLAGLGSGLGIDGIATPLADHFSGHALLSMFVPAIMAPRAGAEDAMTAHPQFEEDNIPLSDEPLLPPTFYEDTTLDPELGRNPNAPLSDHDSLMPWNTSLVQRSSVLRGSSLARQRAHHSSMLPLSLGAAGASSTGGGMMLDFSDAVGRMASMGLRSASASPLFGKGRGGRMRGSSVTDMKGSDDVLMTDQLSDDTALSHGSQTRGAGEEMPPTQIQLDQQAVNFLEFVRLFGEEQGEGSQEVVFDQLLPMAESSRAVAAQGFTHVLSLVSRSLMTVRQEVNVWNGRITVEVL